MATQFLPLDNMKRIVAGARADLKQLRDIDASLRASIMGVNIPRHSTDHIRTETARLRAAAKEMAALYLQSENTLSLLASVKDQREQWTLPRFLASAANDLNTTDTNALLRRLIQGTSIPRMSTEALGDVAQSAADRQDWTTLGAIYQEIDLRRSQGDYAAGALVAGISAVPIPQLAEAQQLMGEAKELEEYVGYTTRSITDGSEDLGAKNEQWHRQAEERRAEQPARP